MEQKLSDTLVKAIDRSNPFMQNLQLASRFNKLIDESGADLEDNHEVEITENGEIEITPAEGKDGMKKVTANVNVAGGADIEANKEATIDVSTYTEPVEIEPTEGKDGMAKATVTLENIPEIEANKTQTIDVSTYTEPVEIIPTSGKDGMAKATVTLSNIPSGGSWQTKTGYLNFRCVMVRVVFTDDTYAYGCLGDNYEDDGSIHTLFFAMGKDYTGTIEDSDTKNYELFTATEVMDWLTQTYNTHYSTSQVADHLEVYL